MSITSDEINFLIYRYLQESGFVHSAFTFAYESLIAKSNVVTADVPPGALISYLQKGLQYVGIEAHFSEDGTEKKCDEKFTLLSPHLCQVSLSSSISKKNKKRRVSDPPNEHDEASTQDNNNNNNNHSYPEGGKDGVEIPSSSVRMLTGHISEVFMCGWSPTEDLLASGSGDSTARIWEISKDNSETQKEAIILPHKNDSGVNKDVTTMEWNRTGTKLATGSYDGQARIWNKTGVLEKSLSCHQGPIFSLKWNKAGNLLLSGGYDNTAIIWDVADGSVKQQFSVHSAPTLDVDWQDNECFASCSTDKSIKICTLGKTDPIKVFYGHQDEVNAIKWNPSGTLLASCSDDYTAKIWSPSKDSCIYDFTEHSKEIYTIKWSPTGPCTDQPNKQLVLASASFDSTVKLWDVDSGKCMYTLALHSDPVYSVAFSPDGDYLASGSLCGQLHIWSVKDGTLIKSFRGTGDIFEVSWNHTSEMVAACFSNSKLCVVDFRR